MATCKSHKIDSNVTGLRFAEEECLNQLGDNPTWYALEPNSYSDFGVSVTTVARNPINPSRQRKKGVPTDLQAAGGFNQDLTFSNTTRLLQGFFFADIRERGTTAPMNAPADPITEVQANAVVTTSNLAARFPTGSLVLLQGFTKPVNNGMKHVSGSNTTTISITEVLEAESNPAKAKMSVVGFRFQEGTVSIALNGKLVQLQHNGSLPELGLIEGEWVYLGSDKATNAFENNKGFARVSRVTQNLVEFDKVSWTAKAEEGNSKSIELYFGSIIRNELEYDLIKRRTYNLERVLGKDENGTMSEYLLGAVPNEMTLTIAQADMVKMDLSFVATDGEQRDGSQGTKAGTRVDQETESAFNTSSDFNRIKLSLVTPDDPAPKPLFAFAKEVNLTINNNVTPNKAVGVMGAFDTSAGTFEVGGSLTAYFADIAGAQAVRNNADVTLDIIMSKPNKALVWDIPLLALGDGRLSVEQDQAIEIPLETNAAQSRFGHTLLFQSFAYLPDNAA